MVHVVNDADDAAAGRLAAPRRRRVGLRHGLLPGAGPGPAAAGRRRHRAAVPHAVLFAVTCCLQD